MPFILIAQDSESSDPLMDSFLEVGYFGPRVGISTLPKSLMDDVVDASIYSLFGWKVDVRYVPSHNKFIGFAESGLFMGAVEQGDPRWEYWGYIGVRRPNSYGFSMGPNFSEYGVGLGISPHYMYNSGNILIPITVNIVLTDNITRVQLITGFDKVSK